MFCNVHVYQKLITIKHGVTEKKSPISYDIISFSKIMLLSDSTIEYFNRFGTFNINNF